MFHPPRKHGEEPYLMAGSVPTSIPHSKPQQESCTSGGGSTRPPPLGCIWRSPHEYGGEESLNRVLNPGFRQIAFKEGTVHLWLSVPGGRSSPQALGAAEMFSPALGWHWSGPGSAFRSVAWGTVEKRKECEGKEKGQICTSVGIDLLPSPPSAEWARVVLGACAFTRTPVWWKFTYRLQM